MQFIHFMPLAAGVNISWDDVDSVLGPHIYVFYAAFLVSFLFTPVMRSIAMYYGIIDQPDNLRKMHTTPVAYLGGVAVFLGWMVGLALSQLHLTADQLNSHFQVKISIVAGAAATVLLGLWDDLRRLKPWIKIGGQILAAVLLLSQGVGTHCLVPIVAALNVYLQHFLGPTFLIPEPIVEVASRFVVICVVVGCCNATNLMDGLDGLCGGVTAVIAAGFLFLAVHVAAVNLVRMHATPGLGLDLSLDSVRIVLALALLGAVLGFVPFNFNPASIFMGDAGSMFLGYACALMILTLSEDQSKWFLAAMVMFALPVLDTALAFARRWVNRRPLFSADRNHFHHQLVARGLSIRKTVLISYSLAVGFCVLGGLIAYMRTRYAGALYLVIFGSIIVAAYKMGMVHEMPRMVTRRLMDSNNFKPTAIDYQTTAVLEMPDTVGPVEKPNANGGSSGNVPGAHATGGTAGLGSPVR